MDWIFEKVEVADEGERWRARGQSRPFIFCGEFDKDSDDDDDKRRDVEVDVCIFHSFLLWFNLMIRLWNGTRTLEDFSFIVFGTWASSSL